RLFYAASSHVFGSEGAAVCDENSGLRPDSIYGVTKAAGLLTCRAYRGRRGGGGAGGNFEKQKPQGGGGVGDRQKVARRAGGFGPPPPAARGPPR
ncbi:GDP-mannose 4,6-dehydratase, partial [Nocardia abscessus]|uniref:GDP-mannose 4,6-dehydratase n=1 Tax=Nocardia abscessus TaxID=120957 RepID=UPI00313C508C